MGSVDRRRTGTFYFLCADCKAHFYRRKKDAYSGLSPQDGELECDNCWRCALFEYYPNLLRVVRTRMKSFKRHG